MTSILKEFREFALKGNVIDLAVGVIIGAAFGKIVDSLVNDVILPLVSFFIGGKVDFSNLFIVLGKVPANIPYAYIELKKAGVPIFAYGNFLTIILNFTLLAFVIFMLVKYLSKIKFSALHNEANENKEKAAQQLIEEQVNEQVLLLRQIRDNLKK